MTILLAHNFYQHRGGEDSVWEAEAALLEEYGHKVFRFSLHNDSLKSMTGLEAAASTVWNQGIYRSLVGLVRSQHIDICHFHNTFPLMSPAAYYAARAGGAAVVQTLHNYRLICPGAVLFRAGKVCEECVGKRLAWPGIVHRCYRQDRLATAVTACATALHRLAGTWRRNVDVYIALNPHARDMFIRGGVPARKIMVKPNFISSRVTLGPGNGGFVLYAGRLTVEKGVRVLLRAWKALELPLPLRIAGEGPLEAEVRAATGSDGRIEFLGRLSRDDLMRHMGLAAAVVFPSLWYEPGPLTVWEAFGAGTPVIGSRLGYIAQLIEDGTTGLLFSPGDPAGIARAIRWLWTHPAERTAMREASRRRFVDVSSRESAYERLLEVYGMALGRTPAVRPDPVHAAAVRNGVTS